MENITNQRWFWWTLIVIALVIMVILIYKNKTKPRAFNSLKCPQKQILENGVVYNFQNIFPSKRNDGTYTALYINPLSQAQTGITNIEKQISKEMYYKCQSC